jgi:hypothetical protein
MGVTPLLSSYGPHRLPSDQRAGLWIPHAAFGVRSPVWRVSQVPRPFCRDALSALTPMGRTAACADCFTVRAGFIISGRLATHYLCFEVGTGSTFRLTARRFAVQRSPAFAQASPPEPVSLPVLRYLHTTDRSYMPNQQFTWQPPFRLQEWPGLPGAPETRSSQSFFTLLSLCSLCLCGEIIQLRNEDLIAS